MSDIAAAVEAILGTEVAETRPLAGGDLSAVRRVTLTDGRTAVAKQGARVAAEARMLGAIRERGVPAPEVLGVAGEVMLLEWLSGRGGVGVAWDDLARVLGRLHGGDARRYGWDEDYAFGTVAIANCWSEDWPAFWAERRLRCHLPYLPAALARRVEALADRTGALLPARPAAALLHGDLWGGNVLAEGARVSGLIDPACYYGDREVDVAMLTLFDVPPDRFFDALKLAPGWRERLPVYRLWPLLVHVRLFGGGYAGSAAAALEAMGF